MERIFVMIVLVLAVVFAMSFSFASDVRAGDADKTWENSPIGSADFFPISVWLQGPNLAPKYKALGINTYFALWAGPTEEQLAELTKHGMYIICPLNDVGMANLDHPNIIGWMHGDEPDNFVMDKKAGKYVPKHSAKEIIADYKKLAAADPTRPIILNLGQKVANDEFKGGWAKEADYKQFVKGSDVVSFDVYPVVNIGKKDGENYLWYQAKGIDRIRKWTKDRKIPWHMLECTMISNKDGKKATPHQVRAEAWIGIVHGSKGITYFVHQFVEPRNSAMLLSDPPMMAVVKKTNLQIQSLASVINSPTIEGKVFVKSSKKKIPIDILVKEYGGSLYIFAVPMRNGAATGSFEIEGIDGAKSVEVVDEDRVIQTANGKFSDDFGAWDVRIYKIAM